MKNVNAPPTTHGQRGLPRTGAISSRDFGTSVGSPSCCFERSYIATISLVSVTVPDVGIGRWSVTDCWPWTRSAGLNVPIDRITEHTIVTADGAENLSAGIPRTADEVEAWVRGGTR